MLIGEDYFSFLNIFGSIYPTPFLDSLPASFIVVGDPPGQVKGPCTLWSISIQCYCSSCCFCQREREGIYLADHCLSHSARFCVFIPGRFIF